MKKSHIRVIYQFLFHVCTLAHLFTIWCFFVKIQTPPVLAFIVGIFGSGVLLYLFSKKWGITGRAIYLFLVAPITVLILMIFQVSPFVSVVVLAYNFRRLLHVYDYEFFSNSSLAVAGGVSSASVSVIAAIIHDVPHPEMAFYLLGIQFFIFYGGYFLSMWYESRMELNNKGKLLGQFSLVLVGSLIIATIFTISMPYVRSALAFILAGAFIPVANIITPWIEAFYQRFKYNADTSGNQTSQEYLMEPGNGVIEGLRDGNTANILPIIFVIVSILIGLLVYKLIKTKPSIEDDNEANANYIIQSRFVENVVSKRGRKKDRAISNIPIRKAMYDFEKKAKKFNKGRIKGETVQEWFQRLEIEHPEIVPIYERVRYGGKSISSDQLQIFVNIVTAIEKKWKSEKQYKEVIQ